MKKISIIVPVYHVEKYMDRCIKSIVNQTYSDIEILLIDDGGDDACPKKCDEWAQKDKRIKVIHQENMGLSGARNTGLNEANGEYILYVDSDDFIEPNACKKLISYAVPQAEIIVGVCREINRNKVLYQKHTNLQNGKLYSSKDYVELSIKNNEWYAPAWLNLYRRDFLINNGLFYKKGVIYEDLQLLPKLFLSANFIIYVDYAFYNYVLRPKSIMTDMKKKNQKYAVSDLNDWMAFFSKVTDSEYRDLLYGMTIKHYLHFCGIFQIKGWKVKGMTFTFALEHALNKKEKAKVVLFQFLPSVFFKLAKEKR